MRSGTFEEFWYTEEFPKIMNFRKMGHSKHSGVPRDSGSYAIQENWDIRKIEGYRGIPKNHEIREKTGPLKKSAAVAEAVAIIPALAAVAAVAALAVAVGVAVAVET